MPLRPRQPIRFLVPPYILLEQLQHRLHPGPLRRLPPPSQLRRLLALLLALLGLLLIMDNVADNHGLALLLGMRSAPLTYGQRLIIYDSVAPFVCTVSNGK